MRRVSATVVVIFVVVRERRSSGHHVQEQECFRLGRHGLCSGTDIEETPSKLEQAFPTVSGSAVLDWTLRAAICDKTAEARKLIDDQTSINDEDRNRSFNIDDVQQNNNFRRDDTEFSSRTATTHDLIHQHHQLPVHGRKSRRYSHLRPHSRLQLRAASLYS